jgi:hypothetical protein
MYISQENKEWLIKNVPNAEALFHGEINPLLDSLGDVIEDNGFDDEGYYNAFGLKAQEVYDDIYEFG